MIKVVEIQSEGDDDETIPAKKDIQKNSLCFWNSKKPFGGLLVQKGVYFRLTFARGDMNDHPCNRWGSH